MLDALQLLKLFFVMRWISIIWQNGNAGLDRVLKPYEKPDDVTLFVMKRV